MASSVAVNINTLHVMECVALYLAIAWLAGWVASGWLTKRVSLRFALAWLVGPAVIALLLWLYGILHIPWSLTTLVAPVAVLAAATTAHATWRRNWRASLPTITLQPKSLTVNLLFLLPIAVNIGVVFVRQLTRPLTTWDAVAMWMLKAKIFLSYQMVTLSPISHDGLRHLDYPPLFSLMSASIGTIVTSIDPSLVAFDFLYLKAVNISLYIGAVILLWLGLRAEKARTLGLACALGLSAYPTIGPYLWNEELLGYADFAVGVYMMAALYFLYRAYKYRSFQDTLACLALAAIAALIKNEGVAFLGIVIVLLGTRWYRAPATWRRSSLTKLGVVAGVLMPVVGWKLYAATHHYKSDLITASNLWHYLLDLPHRATTIFVHGGSIIAKHPDFMLITATLAATVTVITLLRLRRMYAAAIAVILQTMSYLLIYLITPYNIEAFLDTSLDRLIAQLAPSALLLLGLTLNELRQPRSRAHR
jgi:hypothetical protein